MTPADRLAEKRRRAHMEADRRRHGSCCLCQHRVTTTETVHCRGQPERQRGMCADDGQSPRFAFDDKTLQRYP